MRDATHLYFTIILATIFFVVLAAIIVISVSRYYLRKRTHEKEVMEFDKTLMQTRLEMQEQTFTAISQEIHDNSGQLLSLAKLQLNTLSYEHTDQVKEKVGDAVGLITQTIQSLRDLARNLHTEAIHDVGLIKSLEAEIRMIEKLGMLQPVFRVFGTPESLDKDKTIIIFRIVQEALHNVIKHSRATLVDMQVHFEQDCLRVTIQDNGIGLRTQLASDGSGLRNMKDRARVIGAEFNVRPAPEGGTLVSLKMPLS